MWHVRGGGCPHIAGFRNWGANDGQPILTFQSLMTSCPLGTRGQCCGLCHQEGFGS